MLSHLGNAHEVFHDKVILFTWAAPFFGIGDELRRRGS